MKTCVLSDKQCCCGVMQVYQMESKTRGVALIINNHEFHHPMFKDRHGTDEDCDRLRKCFEDNLGFHVTVLPNLRGQVIPT